MTSNDRKAGGFSKVGVKTVPAWPVDGVDLGCVPGAKKIPGAKRINHQAAGSRTRTWRIKDQPPSRRFQDSYLAQKGSTTKPPVPGLVPGAKRINHQAAGSRTRTWRKKDQPPSRRFQDAHLARKGSTTKPPVPGLVPGAKRINHQAASSRMRLWLIGNQFFATCNVTRWCDMSPWCLV